MKSCRRTIYSPAVMANRKRTRNPVDHAVLFDNSVLDIDVLMDGFSHVASTHISPRPEAPAEPPVIESLGDQDPAALIDRSALPPSTLGAADYSAIQHVYTTRLRASQTKAYLKEAALTAPRFQRHFGFSIEADLLEEAGRLGSETTQSEPEIFAHAARLEQSASRRVGAIVHCPSMQLTIFYFGDSDEVLEALTSEHIMVVYLADALTLRTPRQLDRRLDAMMEEPEYRPLTVRPIPLESWPGQVMFMCDICKWLVFCLENGPSDTILEPRYEELVVNGERVVDRPHTGEWQRIYEPHVCGGLGPREYMVGALIALDAMNLDGQQEGTRKLKPGYSLPESFSRDGRRVPDYWKPPFLFPMVKKPRGRETAAQESERLLLTRNVVREAVGNVCSGFDGITRHRYVVGGVTRWAVFGLQALVVDGLDAMGLAFVRQNGTSCCPRCLIQTSSFGSTYMHNVPAQQERTNAKEQATLAQAKPLLQTRGRIGEGKALLQSQGYFLECKPNPFVTVFGCNLPDWSIGRTIAFAPLHTNEEGGGLQTLNLSFQAEQRLRERPGEMASATSEAAKAADAAQAELAVAVAKIAQAHPASLRHSAWSNFGYHFTRDRGTKKPPREYAQLSHCNAWHIKDLLKMGAVILLQPCNFRQGAATVRDSFGTWQRRQQKHVETTYQVDGPAFAQMCVETVCLFNAFYIKRETRPLPQSGVIQINLLGREWLRAMIEVHNMVVTWKDHQIAAHSGSSSWDHGGGVMSLCMLLYPHLLCLSPRV